MLLAVKFGAPDSILLGPASLSHCTVKLFEAMNCVPVVISHVLAIATPERIKTIKIRVGIFFMV